MGPTLLNFASGLESHDGALQRPKGERVDDEEEKEARTASCARVRGDGGGGRAHSAHARRRRNLHTQIFHPLGVLALLQHQQRLCARRFPPPPRFPRARVSFGLRQPALISKWTGLMDERRRGRVCGITAFVPERVTFAGTHWDSDYNRYDDIDGEKPHGPQNLGQLLWAEKRDAHTQTHQHTHTHTHTP